MPYSTDSETLAKLSGSLRSALANAKVSEVSVDDDLAPLLIVEAGHLVVAFALGEGEAEYDILYPAFKKHFKTKVMDWNTKDVSFVYCLPPTHAPTDEFCSKVEVDVYFCRKFVVQLSDEIGASLVRLPFLPLAPVTGQTLRPPSAQTFLQDLGVKADLAKFVVVPGSRSAAAIVTDALAGKYGEPTLSAEPKARAASATGTLPTARRQSVLKSIAIENFRAYRTKREFELGSAVTVLYGPNGFGKTSFFDALDFAATGGIGRLALGAGATPLLKAARHLDSVDGDKTSVTLTFLKDGEPQSMTRDLSDAAKATLNGKKGVDRKEILAFLTGGETPQADRVDNMVSLFRATHLFSQENQQLTRGFADKCEVDGDLVSKMLAFEDYVAGAKKASDVAEVLRQSINQARGQIIDLNTRTEADSRELERLSGLASSAADASAIESSLAAIVSGARKIGVVEAIEGNLESLKGLRLQLEERSKLLETRHARLRSSSGLASARRSATEELVRAQGQATELDQAALAAAEEYAKTIPALEEAHAKSQRVVSESGTADGRLTSIAWVIESKPRFDQLTEQSQVARGELEGVRKDKTLSDEAAVSAVAGEKAAIGALQSARRAAEVATASIEPLMQALRRASEVRELRPALAKVRERIAACNDAIARHMQQGQQSRQAANDLEIRIGRAERALSQIQGRESAVKALVAELRRHVSSGTCLLCAHDHGSMEALLAAIDAKTPQSAGLAEVTAQLANEREAHQVAKARAAEESSKLQAAQSELSQATKERDRIVQIAATFAQHASGLGAPFLEDGSDANADNSVEDRLKVLVAEATARRDQLAIEARRVEEQHRAAQDVQVAAGTRKNQADAAVARLEGSIQLSESTLKQLASDPRTAQASLSSTTEELNELLSKERSKSEELKQQITVALQELALAQAAERQSDARAKAAREAANKAAARRAELDARLKEFGQSLIALGLSADAKDSDMIGATTQAFEAMGYAKNLRDKTQALEVALDAVATAAAMQSIKARVDDGKSKVAQANEAIAVRQPWEAYFNQMAKLLTELQKTATRHFTSDYGPRTAVIQRRLRPVYGFGEIEVSSRGSNIAVHVKRNGESHRPSDFFSQSQVQTLLLGLFLTACSSQTWSGFSSIMMDDPVTHFDDLNTYALLDLLSGLLHSSDGDRQFVISTCDEKLLQLARQKFRHLGSEAKFYRFSAIGSDGPMVSEIPA
ncbi:MULTISPECIES: AAA family ATPase [unclassified Variovorax]|uniref:AAA family ATPase n=1 Tax=unclassified Variovorax TaxID=663243 RepID=UPI0025761A26|nr:MULTISPECIES: AAA family ATPase [unclassified Variovorax]MDM0091650.1 AAA family ATPase [Variovorax sp. J22G40]MDM0146007.1 AAA family ATPase [Variovorax sp. J2P1-31]